MGNYIKRFFTLIIVLLMLLFSIGTTFTNTNIVNAETINNIDIKSKKPFGFTLMGLNPGETVKSIEIPNPKTFVVMVGTPLTSIGLQSKLEVTYILPNSTDETREEDITWDSSNVYNPNVDGDYILNAAFTDPSLSGESANIETVTVTVKGATLANDITSLPTLKEATNLMQTEKATLNSKLISIMNSINLLSAEEKTALENYVGAPGMDKFRDLYDIYVTNFDSTNIANSLDDDWAYIRDFEISATYDGTGPFDTSDDPNNPSYNGRQGNDSGPNNGKVRTFDTVTYDLSYSTQVSGEYDGIKEGYIYYEFILPYSAEQAEWDLTAMGWMGLKVANKSILESKKDGENYYCIETKDVDGVMSQVVTGKRFLIPIAPNPSAFPGGGTITAVLRVLNMKNNSTIQPKFKAWIENNHLDGVCPKHNREEVKNVTATAVTVTSELRLNVQLREVSNTHANGLDTFDFSTGNDLAMNKVPNKKVYGRLTGYGITLQLYNLDPNDGLKGVAFPEGPITFDLEFDTKYELDNGTVHTNLPAEYTPLVWSYEANSSSTSNQLDGRNIAPYAPLRYAVYGGPSGFDYVNTGTNTYSPTTGTTRVWKGGSWEGSQTGKKVSFTVKNYEINPNWFPNSNLGNSNSTDTYFNPKNGVRSTNIGSFAAAELFVIIPFGEGDNYLPKVYNGSGKVKVNIKDSNLRASSTSAGSLPTVTDNSNQTKPNRVGLPLEDDSLDSDVHLSMGGSFGTRIQYSYSDTTYNDLNNTYDNVSNGKDVAVRDQNFAIIWGASYVANGEKKNAIYGLNALMKFDPNGLEIIENKTPHIFNAGSYLDNSTKVTFLYAVKPDGTAWVSDAEMNAATEDNLEFYKTVSEAEAKGIIVGILAESRNDNPRVSTTYMHFTVPVKAKTNAETKKVYQIVQKLKAWKEVDYNNAGNKIQTRYEYGDAVAYPSTYYLNDWVPAPGTYTKSVYNSEGTYVSGHTGSVNIGDSVYLLPYKVAIQKSIKQISGSGEKKNFNLDTNQRVVDFVLIPSIKTLTPLSQDERVDVVIEDVLPKGLSYIGGSAYYGGTYTQNPLPGRQGTITGGEQIDPVPTYDSVTGKTTLTWTIPQVVVNSQMSNIIFSAYIGEPGTPYDVKNSEHLLNKVSISAEEDNREKTNANGNYAEAGITVSKLLSTSIAKVADYKYVETGDTISWTAYVSNNGATPYVNTVMLDVLPYIGDNGGTNFNPTTVLKIEDWSINKDKTNADNLTTWKFYYTTDKDVQGTRSKDYNYNDIVAGSSTLPGGKTVTWTQATSVDSSTGKITLSETENVTALAAIGTLKGSQILVQNIKLSATPSLKAGDKIANSISRDKDETYTPIYIIERSLEGKLWNDKNMDGIQQSGEDVFSEGTVTLLVKDASDNYVPYLKSGNEVSVPLGKQIDINAGVVTNYTDGNYKFVGLPEGMFGVRFEKTDINKYKASPQNVGSDYTDSDAALEVDSEGLLKSTIITGIKMPKKNEMASYSYSSKYNDSGLYKLMSIDVNKVWDDNNNQDGKRTNVTLKLVAKVDGSVVDWATLKAANPQGLNMDATGLITLETKADESYTFKDLPEYYNGKKIVYTVEETIVPNGYDVSYTQSTFTVTNKHTPKHIQKTVNVVWDDNNDKYGKRTMVTLKLVASVDGKEIDWADLLAASATKLLMDDDGLITLIAKQDESHTFDYLPENYKGKQIVYTVEEFGAPGEYKVSYDQDILTAINKYAPKKSTTTTTTTTTTKTTTTKPIENPIVYVVPKTDYDSNIEKWIALFVVSFGGLLVLFKKKYKK